MLEDELSVAPPPEFPPEVIEGLAALSANGLRYPIPNYAIQGDVRAGMAASYGER